MMLRSSTSLSLEVIYQLYYLQIGLAVIGVDRLKKSRKVKFEKLTPKNLPKWQHQDPEYRYTNLVIKKIVFSLQMF